MPPSIKQVALHAGVSTATVSRLLNKPESVSVDTAGKINKAIADLGFRPNFNGRNLRAGRSRTVGVVVPTLSNTVFAQCLQGIELAARALDYSVMFTATEYRQEDEAAAVDLLLNHRVDGVILTVADASASNTLDVLDSEQIPYVLTYNQPQQASRLSVSVDNRVAARDAVAHLIALGHTRIQMLTGYFSASDRAIQRYHGYLDAMRDHALTPMAPIEVPRHTGLAIDYLQAFADPQQRPSALFCSNDLLAFAAMHDLRALGLRVPQDMSVMGFDGIPLGELMSPVLASAVQPSEQIGDVALRTLVAAIEGPAGDRPASRILAHTIRDGGSVQFFDS
ncbi:LacI family DNA-binding transcriptional regulator [Herbaspirillum sp. RV1423]|uniref:LacI family DNA-binding transcriptional regulator n=1 Tax=Herbaspirillum sp. RV1423 TaxID=1443993 RepID=UPI0004B1D148|nr:LacI family DNA-binding transcriptional regulator [Herbaspirillum sp. RV1423]